MTSESLVLNRHGHPRTPFRLRVTLAMLLVPAALAAAQGEKKSFAVPAGSAEKTLRLFSAQSGLPVLFPTDVTNGVRTQAVRGEFPPRQALDLMLSGTALVAVQDEKNGSLTIRRNPGSNRAGAAPPAADERSTDLQKKNEIQAPSTQEPMKRTKLLTRLTAMAAMAAASANAQVAPAPRTAASEKETTIELSPFVVTDDQDTGYLASNTLAGSRLNTPLKDTAASISVFTSEFLSDIGAFDISEAMLYAVNVEFQLDDDRATNPNGNETVAGHQRYRIRGLAASQAQNYFSWSIPSESALIDRIEDSRGPNSVLFGIASPGGLINSMSKQAQTGRSFRKGSLTAGSYDSWRAAFDLNQPARDGRLAFRLNTVYNRTNSFRHWVYQEHQRAHLAGKYIISDRTRIRAEFERGEINSNSPRHDNLFNFFLAWHTAGRPTRPTQTASAAQGIARYSTNVTVPRITYISNNDMTMAMRGMLFTNAPSAGPFGTGTLVETAETGDITDPSINIGGPAQQRFQRFSSFSTFVEHRLARNTFIEVAYNHQNIRLDRSAPSFDTPQRLRGDPNQFLNDGSPNPYAGQIYLEGGWGRSIHHDKSDTARVTFSTDYDAQKWGHYRFGALVEYEKGGRSSTGWEEFWIDAATGLPAFNPLPENEQNAVYRRTYPIEHHWATYFVAGPGRNSKGLLQNVYDPITGRTLSSEWVTVSAGTPRSVSESRPAGMVVGQARYFGGKVIVAGGLRRDELREYSQGRMRDPVTNKWTHAHNPADAASNAQAQWKHDIGRNSSFGLVYHPKPWLSLYYNQANNITLPSIQTRLPDDGTPGNPLPIAPPKGKGKDFGLALNLFENKLITRATYFETIGARQSTTSPSAVRSANVRIMQALYDNALISQDEFQLRTTTGGHGLFDHASRGVEFQTTANPSRNWRFQANYAYLDAVEENLFREWLAWHKQNVDYLSKFNTTGILTSAGRTIPGEVDFYLENLATFTDNDGGTKMGSRRHKVSFFGRYNLSTGWLNGAYVGGGYRFQSKMFTGNDPRDDSEIWSPAFWRADAVAGYTVRRLGKGRRLSFQLNVMNVFDIRDPLITRYQFIGNERFVFRSVPQAPRTWRFTTNFEF
jgi:iron complex outermembrane recepter protein